MKQLFNLSVVSIQHKFFAHLWQVYFFLHIFISHTTLSAQNRDGLSHAWLFEPSRVNVINVHDYNAELQQCLNVSDCFLMG